MARGALHCHSPTQTCLAQIIILMSNRIMDSTLYEIGNGLPVVRCAWNCRGRFRMMDVEMMRPVDFGEDG